MNGFRRHYTAEDIGLLAETDRLHGTLSGPATKKLMERAAQLFGQAQYRRVAGISVSHLYNLRHSTTYARQRVSLHKTQSRAVAISEHYLVPVLEKQLASFPFVLQGFHSDDGSEFVNQSVAKLLGKLLIALTKSRARHSNDNALVESKNGSVVRKQLGYVHIPQHCATPVNDFLEHHLNPYLNYHRPCFFPLSVLDDKGKQRKTYPYERITTPYEKLKSLPEAQGFLKPGLTFQSLDAIASAISDNESARQFNAARRKLFKAIAEQDQQIA